MMTIHVEDNSSQNNSSTSTMASLSAAAAANTANNNIGVMQIHPHHISATYAHTVAATAAAAATASVLDTVNSDLDNDSDNDLRPTKGRAGYVSSRDSNAEDSNLDPEKKSQSELAENEDFGVDNYNGPKLGKGNAKLLLILIDHARTCPGRHRCPCCSSVCQSTKFMMLHVQDCPGTMASYDIYPFAWCCNVKHLLYHLVSCVNPNHCSSYSPKGLTRNLHNLNGLNDARSNK
eukprot:10324787-Ditylum_brightwellii.AAC.1